MIKKNNLIFLLGAGCSKESGIKTSNDMVTDIERYIDSENEEKWMAYKFLYYFLKSSINYSKGIQGNFNYMFNIEDLLKIITDLLKRENNSIYPFIGNWNFKLLELAGSDFEKLKKFKELIYEELFKWINIKSYSSGGYYKKFTDFKNEFGFTLDIFTLNYDILFEYYNSDKYSGNNVYVELGFDKTSKEWNYKNFDENPDKNVGFNLYKLHGSIDWEREKDTNFLKKCDSVIQNCDIIFGTDSKLKSIDPYLFYVYQFRNLTLSTECKLIITIGYSFQDEYINSLIEQALFKNKSIKLLIVNPNATFLKQSLMTSFQNTNDDQFIEVNKSAKDFLENDLNENNLTQYIESEEDLPF